MEMRIVLERVLGAHPAPGGRRGARRGPVPRDHARAEGRRAGGARAAPGVMLLYDNELSGNCYKVRLLLTQLGIPFERRQLSVFDRSDRAEVLGELNPALRVPTLVLDDGRPLGRVERDPLLLRPRHLDAPRGSLRAGPGSAVAVLRAVQPRAEHRRRPLLAPRRDRSRPGRARGQAPRRPRCAGGDGAPPRRAASTSSPSATPSPTSRSTPTRTWRRRGASSSSPTRRSQRGWSGSPPAPATFRSPPDAPGLGDPLDDRARDRDRRELLRRVGGELAGGGFLDEVAELSPLPGR